MFYMFAKYDTKIKMEQIFWADFLKLYSINIFLSTPNKNRSFIRGLSKDFSDINTTNRKK